MVRRSWWDLRSAPGRVPDREMIFLPLELLSYLGRTDSMHFSFQIDSQHICGAEGDSFDAHLPLARKLEDEIGRWLNRFLLVDRRRVPARSEKQSKRYPPHARIMRARFEGQDQSLN